MSDLIIGGPLLFSEPDCPTREGEVVNTLEDIYNIPSPRVGMRVFVKDTKKSYIVTKLKEEQINGVLVPNAKVDEFEDSQPDVAGMNDAIQANATAIKDEKDRAIYVEKALSDGIQDIYNSISTLNRTIINYNTRYGIANAVTKQQVIEDLLNKGTADKGCIVTYYAEDGWHTIQYKLNYYNPTQGVKESNWVEIVNEDTIKGIKDSIDNAYVKPEGGIPKNDLSTEIQEAINNVGNVDDYSVTEQKLSIDVANKLNTAYDKATLADTLFVNDGITFIQGALENTGEIYQGTNFCATSMPILTNGEKITVSGGYKITKYVFYYDGEAMDYGDVDNTDFDSFELAGTESAFIRIEVCRTDNKAISSNEYPNIVKSFIRNPIAWNDSCNLDYFTPQGRYAISGERQANAQDNMPIYNGGNIEARLEVLESDNTLVQILTLLNVGGGDGNIYTRTRQNGSWSAWGKLQTNIEVGRVEGNNAFDNFVDNGIYSGVWTDGYNSYAETFVMITINDYAVAGDDKTITQFKYAYDTFSNNGVATYKSRSLFGGTWSDWKDINEDNIKSVINSELSKLLNGTDPNKVDSLKDLIAWVEEHGADAAEMASAIQANTTAIANEETRAKAEEAELLKRLQGRSDIIEPKEYPFKSLGTFSTVDSLVAKLDTLAMISTATDSPNTKLVGSFRAIRDQKIYTIYNDCSSWNGVFVQTIMGCLTIDDEGKLASSDFSWGIYRRTSSNNNGNIKWGNWIPIADINKLTKDIEYLRDSTVIYGEKPEVLKGAVQSDGSYYSGTSYSARVNKFNGGTTILLNDGYYFSSVLRRNANDSVAEFITLSDKLKYYRAEDVNSIYELNISKDNGSAFSSSEYPNIIAEVRLFGVSSSGGGESSYTLPVATGTVLGGIKSATSRPIGSDVSEGRKCDVYVDGNSGLAHVVVAPASGSSYGVVKVDSAVNANSPNPVSGKAVAEAIDTPIVNQTSTTATIAPNVLNVWGEVTSLDITLAEADATKVNEYMFQFTSGATATTLVLPADIKWVSTPNIQANKTYQVSIINNLGVIGEFSRE